MSTETWVMDLNGYKWNATYLSILVEEPVPVAALNE